jgi:Protein of unknown function (DUF1579)
MSSSSQLSPANEQMKLLAPMEGTFRTEVFFFMGPGEPHKSTGTMINSWDVGGTFLKQHYTGDQSDGPFPAFTGRGYWGYNKVDERYEGFWIDNASTMMQHEQGQVDSTGRSWEMHSTFTHPETKQMCKKRTVFAIQDDDHNSMTTYMEFVSGDETKVMEIRFTRANA